MLKLENHSKCIELVYSFALCVCVCVFVVQNELSILEFIHAIVETYDRYFESVVSVHVP